MTAPMSQPFVYPIGRDFCPRQCLVEKRLHGKVSTEYIPATVADIVSRSQLQREGLQRNLSIYTTHTVCTHDLVRQDSFFLENPMVGIKIPCQLDVISDRGGTETLHRLHSADFQKIPEKLWQSYRDRIYIRGFKSDLTILILDFALQVGSEHFANLPAAFAKRNFNTLPLHLVHRWTFKNVAQKPRETNIPPGWVEEQNDTRVLNIWKDFIIVTREEEVEQVTLGVASDFHYSDRNDYVRYEFPSAEDINGKLESFAEKAFRLWKRGEMDYLVMNGDFVDYVIPEKWPEIPHPDEYYRKSKWPDYDRSNWRGFEEVMGLFLAYPQGWAPVILDCLKRSLKLKGFAKFERLPNKLFNIPIFWNAGDHDRLIGSTILPRPVGQDWGADEITRSFHYNFYGTGFEESKTISENTNSNHLSYSGRAKYYVGPLRWIYERARIDEWPLNINLTVGGRTFRIHILDTGSIRLNILELRPCEGIQTPIDDLDTGETNDFTIVITHSPPISVDPSDEFFGQQQIFSLSPQFDEASYGSFLAGRDDILQFLSDQAAKKQPTLVVSGHVHFKEAYFLSDSGADGGQVVWEEIESLNAELIPADQFWSDRPCLLLTTPPIGPKPTRDRQSSEFLLVRLEAEGVTKLIWPTVEV